MSRGMIVAGYYLVGVAGGVLVSMLMASDLVRSIVGVGLALLALGIFVGAKGSSDHE